MTEKISIAIDGPAGAGKSTVAKIVAKQLDYIYIDTGAMYRALTYKALEKKIDTADEDLLYRLLMQTSIQLQTTKSQQIVLLDGADVTNQIRSNEVNANVSIVSAHGKVRSEMVKRQRQMGSIGGVVMDGRDIGTAVLPNAEIKVFLEASVEERARRRHAENLEKQIPTNLEQLMKDIAYRDHYDSTRKVSPLMQADDATLLDSTTMTIDEVVQKIVALAKEKIAIN